MKTPRVVAGQKGNKMSDEARWFLVQVMIYIGAGAVLIWIISFAIRSAAKKQGGGDVVVDNKPGTFKVIGVNEKTGDDVVMSNVVASSPGNARVKVELKGVRVTSVERKL